MIIKVLAENTAFSEGFETEHGLSLYIQTEKRKILFDTGETNVFYKNAEKLGVDISEIDLAVISHGHVDHGGGLKRFLKENTKAPVYLHPKALGMYYSKREAGEKYIGLVQEYKDNDRFIFTGDRFFVDTGIELFSNILGRELLPLCNQALFMERDGEIVPDTFEHEQNMVITEAGKTFLFAGCAHNGIVNIAARFKELKGRDADYVFGGFHLYNRTTKKSESRELVSEIGKALKGTQTKYYTCHCTGLEAYRQLKAVMGEQLEYLAAGRVLEL